MTVQIAIRLPDLLVERVDRLAADDAETRSDVVRRAVEEYVYRRACEADAARYDAVPLTDSELALADDAGGWEPTPAW